MRLFIAKQRASFDAIETGSYFKHVDNNRSTKGKHNDPTGLSWSTTKLKLVAILGYLPVVLVILVVSDQTIAAAQEAEPIKPSNLPTVIVRGFLVSVSFC